ncbi:MAG: sigma-70 family RNA polymerase sigma factor [bacterium]|nr:sigma-70 family RNA polymerase sigma factor [bacterium]
MKSNQPLIDRLIADDPRAQRELFNKFNSRIFMYFRLRIKGEESYDDLVQDVFTSFFVAIGKNKVTEDKFIAPYIFGIAKRVMFNFFYKKKRDDNIQKKGENHLDFSCEFEEEERLTNEAVNNIIQSHIKKLPEIDRIILKEFYLKENNIGEVAEILGKTKHYVSVRKERALKKIKSEILKKKDVYGI